MTISDEQLSAFLDAELPEPEMELIRQQLSEDASLTNRLAELAMVDTQIASHYAHIDARAMPEAITQLLAGKQKAANTSATVIAFPLRKRVHSFLQQHAAMAASVALLIGFGAAQLLPGDNADAANNWNAVAQVLDQQISGTAQTLGDGSQIKPRLSFINQDRQLCRQFQTNQGDMQSDNIACRIDNRWQLSMSVYSHSAAQDETYQTASGGSLLDKALDEMISGEVFDAEAEAQAIKNQWQRQL
jgi:hypothetical protein